MKEINLQLYSLRNELKADFEGTIKKVAEMGYTGVEFAGYGGLTSAQMKELLNKYNLKAVSSHVSLGELENTLDFHIDFLSSLGCKNIVCPHSEMNTAEDAINIAERLNVIADKCAMRGMDLGYHNHAHEFKMENDEYFFDIMMNHCNDLIFAQLDVYWVAFADADPLEMIRKYAGRIPTIHLKQLGFKDGEKRNVIFSEGTIDFKEVIRVSKMLGTEHFIVEQESSAESALESCKQNIDYLKSL